uniref:Fibrinogen C-terminal domain-containing protein n=1 Tax=Anas zonorhyncha TaxID=75864 RepID=A0A8B9VIC7_9AVES
MPTSWSEVGLRPFPAKSRRSYYPRDCFEIFQRSKGNCRDGLYIIQPKEDPIVVSCNMQDGGWTVIQHITANSTVDFDRTWQDYKYGFGSVHDNHWLGNEYMHQLTGSSVQYVLGVKLVDLNAEIKWGQYEPFLIEDEKSQYRIRVGLYKGNATDALTLDTEAYLHDNQKFTTKDRDNDNYFQNCAKLEHNGIPGGGWWYDACAGANLNRRNVIYWQKDCNKKHLCKFAWMMVKPIDHSLLYATKSCPCQKEEL